MKDKDLFEGIKLSTSLLEKTKEIEIAEFVVAVERGEKPKVTPEMKKYLETYHCFENIITTERLSNRFLEKKKEETISVTELENILRNEDYYNKFFEFYLKIKPLFTRALAHHFADNLGKDTDYVMEISFKPLKEDKNAKKF